MNKQILKIFLLILIITVSLSCVKGVFAAEDEVISMPIEDDSFADAVANENGELNLGSHNTSAPTGPATGTSAIDGRDTGIAGETAPIGPAGNYKLLETVSGEIQGGKVVTFPTYVTGLYKFAIGIVSIAALLMIVIGGFYYIASAGNQAQATTAKKIITDAILGLIVVFIIVLVLKTINPDLLKASPSMDKLRSAAESTE